MVEYLRHTKRAQEIGPYKHDPLESDLHIRLIHLLPGKLGDGIRMQISHVLLDETKQLAANPGAKRLSRSELQKTLPPRWEVFETPETRYLFWNDPNDSSDENTDDESEATSDAQSHASGHNSSIGSSTENSESSGEFTTSWTHPDPKIDPSLYLLPHDSEMWNREPAFEALSYVWGSPDDPILAFVESPAGEATGTLMLGQNLTSALQNLRYEDSTRVLWVDAVCINQSDNEEKAVQVKRMSSIYGLTTRVAVWLGEEDDDSALAISTLAHVGAQVETTLDGFRLVSPDAQERTWYDIDVDLGFSDEVWLAIHYLARRPWFTRVWTVQEIVLANRLAMLQCGDATISWALFRRAVECLLDKQHLPLCRLSLNMARMSIINGKSWPLALVLKRHRNRKCFDRHDKVYGMLAMAPPSFVATIKADYTEAVEETYKSTFLINIKCVRRWELYGCEHRTIGGPSWVPDLYGETSFDYDSPFQLASGCSELHFEYRSPDKLDVKGIRVDIIQSIKSYVANHDRVALSVIRSWEPPDILTASYPAGGSLLEAFVITLVQNCIRERHPIEEGWPSLAELKRYCQNKLFSTASQPIERLSRSNYLDDIVYQRCRDRAMFTTTKGSIGLAPASSQPGK